MVVFLRSVQPLLVMIYLLAFSMALSPLAWSTIDSRTYCEQPLTSTVEYMSWAIVWAKYCLTTPSENSTSCMMVFRNGLALNSTVTWIVSVVWSPLSSVCVRLYPKARMTSVLTNVSLAECSKIGVPLSWTGSPSSQPIGVSSSESLGSKSSSSHLETCEGIYKETTQR